MRRVLIALLGLAAAAVMACTQSDLLRVPEPPPAKLDDRVSLHGDFCTTDPDTMRFPVRILFVIDQSQSLGVTDPPDVNGVTGRRLAMEDAYFEFISGRTDVEVAVISFGPATMLITEDCEPCDDADPSQTCQQGFTACEEEIATNIVAATSSAGGGLTNYAETFSLIYQTLFADMASLSEEDAANARYIVIFLTDAQGAVEIDDLDVYCPASFEDSRCDVESNTLKCKERYGRNDGTPPSQCRIYSVLEQIMQLDRAFSVRSIEFHPVLLMANRPDSLEYRPRMQLFMRYLAGLGDGVFRDFDNGEDINFLFLDPSSYKRQFKLHNLIVSNLSARPWSAPFLVDSDSDGVDDVTETMQGSDMFSVDSDGDGFNDLLEYQLRNSGRDPIDPADAACALSIDKADDDFDGLRNCEERLLGSSGLKFDSDFDGVPDLLEHRFDTYLTLDDLATDSDFDGAPAGDEIRWHTDPNTNDSARLADEGYRYTVRQTGYQGNQLCYHYDIHNIRLVTTEAIEGEERGWNDLRLFITEVPLDEPDSVARFKLGCARARFVEEDRFKLPASGELDLPAEFLWEPGATDTPVHECVDP